jgi:FKBP-type peptidyl-prolyl cis-trans isomerase SlyD
MIQNIPRANFENIKDLQVGMNFQFTTAKGDLTVLRAIEITPNYVTLDGNHPLAGLHLNFDIEVLAIREATIEELQHGHLHRGAGCCGGDEDGGHNGCGGCS